MNLTDDSPWDDEPRGSENNGQDVKNPEKDPTPKPNPETESSIPTPSGPGKAPIARSSRTPRRNATQTTQLEAVDDALGPLGPLGANSSAAPEPGEPPELPLKERHVVPSSRPSTVTIQPPKTKVRAVFDPTYDEDENSTSSQPRRPPPVEPAVMDGPRRQTPSSLSVGQAAKPTFSISVGDPHKVGDLTSSHTNYQVRTKTTSKAYRIPEFEVSRRYRDFLWLYNQLHSNNPGVVVPPPPEKQAVGRFGTDFVESRRSALERMLSKTAAHPILQHDGDLKLFLESDAFSVDVKHRERKDPDMPVESKSMFSGLSLSVGSASKFIEHDDWFLDRCIYLDNLEIQLKALLRSTDAAVLQRKALADASFDLSTSLNTLSQVELAPSLSGPLASLSDLHLRIRELYDCQAQQDVLTLGIVIDEYIRLIGSIKKAFDQRQRSWQSWHSADSDLQKRKSALDKMKRQGRSQQDRLSQLQADVGDAERRAHQARLQFEELGKGMRVELERFEKEKVEDFRMGVETYLESAVEAQKELIELWETYLMHLDADEDGAQQFNPPMEDTAAIVPAEPPHSAGEDAASTFQSQQQDQDQEHEQEQGQDQEQKQDQDQEQQQQQQQSEPRAVAEEPATPASVQ